jgi:hypothetical protein
MLPVEAISEKILTIRGKKVILASDLAEVYGVATKALNQAVKRNAAKFPPDFMFQITAEEAESLCFHRAWRHYGGTNRSRP